MLEYSNPVSVSESHHAELLKFAIDSAIAAGAETLPYFRADAVIENKLTDGRFDPVTQADKAVEVALRELIRARYPEHGIFGEEFGHEAGNGLTWVIDPVDGTRAFMSGMLHWGLLLALFDGARPIIGVMYQPYTEEIWFGDGRSATFRRGTLERPLRVRHCDTLQDAVMATTSPLLFEGGEQAGFARLEGAVKLSRYGGDCYLYGMLAMGFIDLATDGMLNPYDIQALVPIIQGAGGIVTTYSGGDASMGGTVLAAGNPALHRTALELLNR